MAAAEVIDFAPPSGLISAMGAAVNYSGRHYTGLNGLNDVDTSSLATGANHENEIVIASHGRHRSRVPLDRDSCRRSPGDGTSGGNAGATAPVLLTGRLVGPLHVSAGRHGSVTVSESFAGRLTRVDSEGNHDSPLRNP